MRENEGGIRHKLEIHSSRNETQSQIKKDQVQEQHEHNEMLDHTETGDKNRFSHLLYIESKSERRKRVLDQKYAQ